MFDTIEDYKARVADPSLPVEPGWVLVLKSSGPVGIPGWRKSGIWGSTGKPQQGVTDMVRISDARMSGTAYGTVIQRVSPEAAVGGTLALVQDGDFMFSTSKRVACSSA